LAFGFDCLDGLVPLYKVIICLKHHRECCNIAVKNLALMKYVKNLALDEYDKCDGKKIKFVKNLKI